MVAFSMDELARSLGEGRANFAKNMANEAANFACGLYKDFPGAIIKNPADSFLRGFWDTLCDRRPPGLPTPPSLEFEGGQCQCVPYGVRFRFPGGFEDGATVWGEVAAARVNHIQTPGTNRYDASIEILCRGSYDNGFSPCKTKQEWSRVGYIPNSGGGSSELTIISVVRRDGQPDTCGSLPTPWFPTVVIPPNRLNTTVTNVYNDSTSIQIPLVYAPISSQFGVNINVGGVNLSFDLGGVTFDFGFDSSGPGQNIDDKITNIQNNIKRIENYFHYYPQPPSDGDFDTIVIPDMPSGKVDADEELQWVLIELTNIPKNAKTQYGGNAQDILYGGWFQFMVGDFCLPREPVHFKKSIFKRPPGATAYSFTLYTGFKASVKEYRSKPISDSNSQEQGKI